MLFDVNCCVAPSVTVEVVGATVNVAADCSVTMACANLVASVVSVARTVTAADAGIIAGAVYRPAASMDPAVAVHVTMLFDVNCCVAPSVTVEVVGATVTGAGGGAATAVTDTG